MAAAAARCTFVCCSLGNMICAPTRTCFSRGCLALLLTQQLLLHLLDEVERLPWSECFLVNFSPAPPLKRLESVTTPLFSVLLEKPAFMAPKGADGLLFFYSSPQLFLYDV